MMRFPHHGSSAFVLKQIIFFNHGLHLLRTFVILCQYFLLNAHRHSYKL